MLNNLFLLNFYSPLEQFETLPVIPINFDFSDSDLTILNLTITNETLILYLIFFFFIFIMQNMRKKFVNSSYIIPENWQLVLEVFINLVVSLVKDNISGEKTQKFFSLIFVIFMFLVFSNCIGMFPYSFTVTSNLLTTFYLGISLFLGINIIAIEKHGIKIFSLFLPSGISIYLSFLLIPIEFISYVFKPISLSIRLFANMMAGHTLLKVIAGFIFTLASSFNILLLASYVPAFILLPLFGLEFAVALIQSFVFSVLICIYINDSLNLH